MAVDSEAVGLAHHARAFPAKPALVGGAAVRTYGAFERSGCWNGVADWD